MGERMRLDRLLCTLAGVSRSQAQKLVRAGHVTLNGDPVREAGLLLDPTCDAVALNGQALAYARALHVMLHKPAGLLTAASDARAATVMDLLPASYARSGCMPVGRLDKATEGLLLFSTDGALAHRLLSPRRHVRKQYLAEVDAPLDAADVQAFAAGLALSDFTALPAELEILESGAACARALCTVGEGKYHQVRRMFAARGCTVTYLKRLTFGPLALDEALAPGAHRVLTEEEVQALYDAVALQRSEP